jgi:hypothetical protein
MNIVEYFVNKYLNSRLDDTEERIAALNELLSHWNNLHAVGKPGVLPEHIQNSLAGWKAERATLMVRRTSIRRRLKIESSKERDV